MNCLLHGFFRLKKDNLPLIRPSLNNFNFGRTDIEREGIQLLRRLRSLVILSVVIVETQS